ncbi:iron complex outermembrane recepter protein [Rhizobacter sp. OV335]|nr:iron complex outermembrane recepter protein [Rhizobacter sp. OV335]
MLAIPAAQAQTATVAADGSRVFAPVIVTATRFPEDASKLPFGVSVITSADIREAGVTTVNEAIMKLLGVPGRLDFYGGGDYSLDLRNFGTTSDNNQAVIVDGIKISEADLGGTRLAGIPIDSVERIEVIRGSGAVLYGEGATGGVIVITTKAGAGLQRKSGAQVYAAMGSHALLDTRASGTVVAGKFSLDVAGNHRETDNHRDNFRSEIEGASATAQWQVADGIRVGARTGWDQLDSGLPGSLTAAQYADNPRQTNTPNDRGRIRNRNQGLFGSAVLGDWQLGLDAGWRDKHLESTSSGVSTYGYDINAKNYALRARNEMALAGGRNALSFGIDHADWTRDVPGAFGGRADQTSRALYAKDDYSFASGTRVSVGGRSEHIEKTNTSTTAGIDDTMHAWELGLLQPLSTSTSVYARFGHSYRLANADEFSFTTPDVPMRPQTSRDTEIGLRWQAGGTRTEVRAYRSKLTDEIGYNPNADGPYGLGTGANVNLDPTRRQGIEAELSQALGSTANVRVVAARRQARFTAGENDGKDVPLTAKTTLALRGDWSFAAGHRVDAGVNYVSSQTPDFANACTMPAHTTLDLRYAYQWQMLEFALGVTNVTDKQYYTLAFRCVGGQTSSIYPEDGRAFTGSVRIQF